MFKFRFTPLETKCTKANLRSPKGDLSLTGFKKKGIVLLIVLATLLVVVILAAVILNLVLSHTQFTQHQTNRIQAYYASMAGINYGLEKLRIGLPDGWTSASCPPPGGCSMTFQNNDFNPPVLINPDNGVTIIIRASGSPECSYPSPVPLGAACISAVAEYTNP